MTGTSSSNFGLLAVGSVFIAYGLVSIILAVTDFRQWMSTMYDNNKNRKTGFGAISRSATRYRTYIGLSGAVALVLGILAVAHG